MTNTGGTKGGGRFLFFLGENFGETASPVDITIGGQKCLQSKHYGWDQTITLEHSWPNSGRPYLSCIPQETRVGEKGLKIEIAYRTIVLQSASSKSSSPFYARCIKNYYGLLGEHCVSCWKYRRQTKYSKSVKDGELKIYAADCTGDFTPNFGTSEPLAKGGFAILPPPECKSQINCFISLYIFL